MSSITTLAKCTEKTIVIVKTIHTGHKAHVFLADLGIHEGEKIRVIKNDYGPIIVEVKGTRVAIGRGLAAKISVQSGCDE